MVTQWVRGSATEHTERPFQEYGVKGGTAGRFEEGIDSKAESRQTYRAPGQTDGSDLLGVQLSCETSTKEPTKLPTCRLYVQKVRRMRTCSLP